MSLDHRIKALVAIGAAVSANCQPCLESTLTLALESGAEAPDIAAAIEVGKTIRRGAAAKMDLFAGNLGLASLAETAAARPVPAECGCQ
jgi:AhpD family alkylhydroperoxidase